MASMDVLQTKIDEFGRELNRMMDGLSEYVGQMKCLLSLEQMEHDLNDQCECDGCTALHEIKRKYIEGADGQHPHGDRL